MQRGDSGHAPRRGRNDDDGPQTDAAAAVEQLLSAENDGRTEGEREEKEDSNKPKRSTTANAKRGRERDIDRSMGIWLNYPGNATHACVWERARASLFASFSSSPSSLPPLSLNLLCVRRGPSSRSNYLLCYTGIGKSTNPRFRE